MSRTGLAGIFGKDERFTLLATAADGERFMQAVERLAFDIGIIGWDRPYMNGRQVLEALGETPAPPSATRGEPPGQLVETVAAVSEGRMVFPFMDLNRRGEDPLESLTNRERELLAPSPRVPPTPRSPARWEYPPTP